MNIPRWKLARPEDAPAQARITALQEDPSPEAAEYKSFLEEYGLTLTPNAHPRDRAKELFKFIEDRIERLEGDRADAEAWIARTGVRSGPPRSKLRRIEAEIAYLTPLSDRLFAYCNPPAIGWGGVSQEPGDDSRICSFCDNRISRQKAWEQAGQCDVCWSIASGAAERPRKSVLEEEVAELVGD